MLLDFVAIRDIHPDEEIFLDYGKAWEDAWDAHIERWSTPCGYFSGSSCMESSKKVSEMNKDMFNTQYHKWSDVHMSVCHFDGNMVSQGQAKMIYLSKETINPFDLTKEFEVKYSYEGIEFDDDSFGVRPFDGYYGACKILQSNKKEDTFDVIFFLGDRIPRQYNRVPGARLLVRHEKLPAKSLQFRTKPLKSDEFAPNAFRHEIEIPIESFPPLWLDLEK